MHTEYLVSNQFFIGCIHMEPLDCAYLRVTFVIELEGPHDTLIVDVIAFLERCHRVFEVGAAGPELLARSVRHTT